MAAAGVVYRAEEIVVPDIDYRNIAALKTHPRNPRDGNVGAIISSILEFGFNAPLCVWKDNVVIAGNHRLMALQSIKAQGLSAPRGLHIEGKHWLVPCVDASALSETKALAYMVGDNRLSDIATNDDQQLAEILTTIAAEDEKLLLAAGFDGDDLDELLAQLAQDALGSVAAPEAQIDRAEELRAQWNTERGQLWAIGSHRLLCGDCRIADDVARVMGGDRVDIVIADAPYGMNLNTHYKRGDTGEYNGVTDANRKNYRPVIGDDTDFDPRPVMDLIPAKEQFWFGADYYAECIPDRNNGSWLVWDKRAGIEDIDFTLSEFELIWSRQRHARIIFRVKWFGIQGMEKQDTKERVHPTQKPVELISLMLQEYSKKGQHVVDPFLGSGTTMVVAHQLQRTCYGIELDPSYVAVTLQRLADMGLTPHLA